MNEVTQGPRQFSGGDWLAAMFKLRDSIELWEAFNGLIDVWYDIAHAQYQEAREVDVAWAEEEFDLDLHVGQVRYRNLHWLRQTFEPEDLSPVALTVGRLLHPGERWEVIANDTHEVVTNAGRTLVIDLKHGDQLSAEASLALAGARTSTAARDEAMRFLSARVAERGERLARLAELLGDGEAPTEPIVH